MNANDEARTLRRRLAALEPREAADCLAANPTRLVKTVAVSLYPTAAAAAYAVQRLTPSGQEAEGAGVTLTPVGPVFYALGTGTAVPPVGTTLLVTAADGRWTFRYD
jgi:hypothetical protein